MSGLDKKLIGSLNMLDNLMHKIKKKRDEKFLLTSQVVKLRNLLSGLENEKGNIEGMNKTILISKVEIHELERERYYLQTSINSLKGQHKVYEQVTKKMEILQERVDRLETRSAKLQKEKGDIAEMNKTKLRLKPEINELQRETTDLQKLKETLMRQCKFLHFKIENNL